MKKIQVLFNERSFRSAQEFLNRSTLTGSEVAAFNEVARDFGEAKEVEIEPPAAPAPARVVPRAPRPPKAAV